MTPLEMIAEWRKGCSCAPPGRPEECHACTVALIDAIERALRLAAEGGHFEVGSIRTGVRFDGEAPVKPTPPPGRMLKEGQAPDAESAFAVTRGFRVLAKWIRAADIDYLARWRKP